MNQHIKISKYISVFLSFCIIIVMMYFLLFTVENEIHQCTGTDCSVCHELQIAASFIKQFGIDLFGAAVSFLALILLTLKISIVLYSVRERTLILDKVRMDD